MERENGNSPKKGYTDMYDLPLRKLMLKSGDRNWCEEFQTLRERELSTDPDEQFR